MDFINTLGEGNIRDLDLDGILGDFYINYDNYCVSFIEIGQTNDIL
jgi:hypothetical protein